jgi:hypothetical protein
MTVRISCRNFRGIRLRRAVDRANRTPRRLPRHWLEVLREDDRAIIRAASAASKAADYLLAFRDANAAAGAGFSLAPAVPAASPEEEEGRKGIL